MSPGIAPGSKTRARALALFILLVAGPSLFAFAPCEDHYERVLTLVSGRMYLSARARTEALKKLKAAWRSYLREDEKSRTEAVQLLGEARNEFRERAPGLPIDGDEEASLKSRDLTICMSEANDEAFVRGPRRRRPADPLPSDLEIAEAHDGVLESGFKTFTVRLLDDDGKTIPATRLGSIQLISQSGPLDVTPMFALNPDGTIRLEDVSQFRRAVNKRFDPFRLSVRAFQHDTQYESAAGFVMGRYTMRVRLLRPAGTTFPLRSTHIWLMSDRTVLTFESVTNADGIADFPPLPDDHYRVACVPEIGGKRYFGRTEVELDRNAGIVDLPLYSTVTEIERRPGDEGWWRADDEHTDWTHIFSVFMELAGDGSLHPNAWKHEVQGPPAPDSEEALHDAIERDKKTLSDPNPMKRTVIFRVYDERGRVVFRRIAAMEYARLTSYGRSENAKPFAQIEFPARATGRLELDSADPRLRGSFDIAQLFAAVLKEK
jgi:hypothetical protein